MDLSRCHWMFVDIVQSCLVYAHDYIPQPCCLCGLWLEPLVKYIVYTDASKHDCISKDYSVWMGSFEIKETTIKETFVYKPGTSLTEVWHTFILVALWQHYCGFYARISLFSCFPGGLVYFYWLQNPNDTSIATNQPLYIYSIRYDIHNCVQLYYICWVLCWSLALIICINTYHYLTNIFENMDDFCLLLYI